MTDLVLGINAIYKDAKFRIINNDYKTIVWRDERPQPTEEEIQAKIQELQAQYDANEYQRQRATAYPTWQDQLDKIYHEGIDAWKAEIQAIKDQYPKPDGA